MNQTKELIDYISRTDRYSSRKGSGIRFLCPYCQNGLVDHKGKKYTEGKAKGYIYKLTKGSYEFWNFKCFMDKCPSGKSFLVEKLIQDHYPELLSREQKEQLVIQELKKSNAVDQFNRSKSTKRPSSRQSQENTQEPVSLIQKLPRSSPQHQAGKGSILEQKLKQRRSSSNKTNKWERQIPPVI